MSASSIPQPPSVLSSDEQLMKALCRVVSERKGIVGPLQWVSDGARNLRFARTLELNGVTQEGLILFGRASEMLPDRHVTLGLRYDIDSETGGHFERLDWRPIDAHNNKALGPPEWRFVILDGSHHHSLRQNASLDIGLSLAMRRNLPVAVPLSPDPDWDGFVADAARLWNIPDILYLPQPPWQSELELLFPSNGRSSS